MTADRERDAWPCSECPRRFDTAHGVRRHLAWHRKVARGLDWKRRSRGSLSFWVADVVELIGPATARAVWARIELSRPATEIAVRRTLYRLRDDGVVRSHQGKDARGYRRTVWFVDDDCERI